MEFKMTKSALLAAVAVAAMFAVPAFAQGVDVSSATGNSTGQEASTSNVTGFGENMSGGMIDSASTASDLSFAAGGRQGAATGSTGQDESDVAEMTFDVGAGHDVGTATGSGAASGGFAGFSATVSHHH
jgi:hypothetical protein